MGQILIDSMPLEFTLTEAEDRPGKYIARGQFARADKPTDNKRFYGPHLWEREIGRLSDSMKGRMVFGELDHPCLISDDFRVLTLDGWKDFRDINPGDKVWSRVDGEAVVSTVEEIVDEPYSGPAIRFKGRSIDATFTPAHRFLMVNRPGESGRGEEEYILAGDLAENMGRHAHSAIPKTATWFSEGVETFVVPGVTTAQPHKCKNDVTKDFCIDARVFAAFMGLYLAEGNCSADSTDTHAVFIHQRPGWSADYIYDEVLSKFPDDIVWTYDGKSSFYTADARLRSYLKRLGNVYEKYIPAEVKALDADCLKELVFWFGIGDGRMVASNGKSGHGLSEDGKTFKEVAAERLRQGVETFTRRDVFSVSERLVRDLHECVVRAGGSGVVSAIEQVGDREIEGRVIKEENRSTLFQLHIGHSKNIWLDPRFLKTEQVQHDGNIYCLKTTHGNFYMEREGHSFWTGNSDGRTKLTRVSHILTDLHMDGPEIVGEAEIIDTPNGRILKAILDANGKVGVSSRGFGTTKVTANGVHEVQEDFQLHTFDFVADPAMKTAYPEVFHEETQKIPEDGMELTLEDLKRDYPGLVEALSGEAKRSALTEANEAHGRSLSEAVAEAEERTERRLREQFSGELRRTVESIEEAARERATSEALSDPEVAQAKVTLEQIARIIAPFGVPLDQQMAIDAKDEEIAKLKGQIAERELEVQASRKQAKEYQAVATEAVYQLHLERLVSEDDARDTIIKLVGDIKQYQTTDEIEAKVEAVKDELTRAKMQEQEKAEEKDAEFQARLEELDARIKAAEEKAEQAETEKVKANERTRKALHVAEEMQVALHIEQRLRDHKGGDDLRGLCESAKTTDEVDNIIAGYDERHPEPPRIDEEQAQRIRNRVARGKERDINEDTYGRPNGKGNGAENANDPLAALGLTEEQFDKFAGTKGFGN